MLTRWNPYRTMRDLEKSFDRWEPFSLMPYEPLGFFRPWGAFMLDQRFPGDNLAVDLYEEGDKLVLKTALPGVRQEDVEVTEQDGILTIRAHSEREEERSGYGWRMRERRSGAWQRSLRLPVPVDADRAKAELRDGVLTVTLPQRKEAGKLARRIPVSLPKIKLPALTKPRGKIRVKQS